MVIATFVTMVDLLMKAYLPALNQSLGIFIPLIVVNCIILARAEAFASKNGVMPSIMDGVGTVSYTHLDVYKRQGSSTERYCRNGEEIGDRYTCTYGCPVNADGQGICSKTMMMLYPIMEAVRSGGDLENIGGSGPYTKDLVCPDGCVMFRLTARKLGNENFFKGKFFD